MFFDPLLSVEARAAVEDITVVRQVFSFDKTFDLPCLSAAVGFTVASVGSFRSNQSFLAPSFVLKGVACCCGLHRLLSGVLT